MAGKRKRSRKTTRTRSGSDDNDEESYAPRTSRPRVNYAESDDDDDFDDEKEESDNEQVIENDEEEEEAEETFSEDEDSDGISQGRRAGRSLHVRLRLRKNALGNGSNGSAAAENGVIQKEEDESVTQNGVDDDVLGTRRPNRRSSIEKQSPNSAKPERRLSGTSIRQQLLQQASQSLQDRPGTAKRASSQVPDDDEFEIESEDESEESNSSSSEAENNDRFVVDDSDFSDALTRRRSSRRVTRSVTTRSQKFSETDGDDDGPLTLQEELAELNPTPQNRRKNLRARRAVNYQILPPPANDGYDEMFAPAESRRRTNTGGRRLYSTYGPFGGAGIKSIFGYRGPDNALQAAGGAADSDSSDDEAAKNPTNKLPNLGDLEQVANPASSLGLVKKNNLSDTDPLGVDMNIDFSAVGGLDEHIRQLKEMVALPLLYPEVFQRFKVTPPRGVLFHGPPGTGKTLLARALAASCSTHGRKISFYMRKGADALSKWVGEAERQLRLLFEEARNTQPSIIFFDEIDGESESFELSL